MRNIKIITSLEQFNFELDIHLAKADYLLGLEEINNDLFLKYKSQSLAWQLKIEAFFYQHFDDPDKFLIDRFKQGDDRFYGLYYGGMKESLADQYYDLRGRLHNQRKFLTTFKKVLPALNKVIGINPLIDISDARVEDKFYLIIKKLYELKDNNYYPVMWILEGNGIVLIKHGEFDEIFDELSKMRLIKTAHTHLGKAAQITLKGELELSRWERARKRKRSNNNKNNIDQVIKELRKLGLGQEILFEELEELKNLTSKLNKKNWTEIVKGKLVDLTVSKIITTETAKFIYNKVLPGESISRLLE